MADVLIRNVPDSVLARIDERALRLGLSRSEYLRRRIGQDTEGVEATVTVDHFTKFADLGDVELMRDAWS
ncbi:MAG: ribbon-helix-helix protein, CopG family [Actinomycetota bacterium]|nr:ribbon-helix-helix protein, CopG family [Actinomycetota bacterium]